MKNYYLILGLKSDATDEEIKTAYRRQAKELHPDYYGENCEPFLALQEAYAVLSDPQRRRDYDRQLRARHSQRSVRTAPSQSRRVDDTEIEPLIPDQPPIDLGDIFLTHFFVTYFPSFEELFNRFWSNFTETSRPKAERMESIQLEISITPLQAFRGGTLQIMIPAEVQCPTCHGQGGVGFFECWRCEGEGRVLIQQPLTISFPAGIRDNYVEKVPLKQFGIHNFYLTIHFRVSEELEW